MNGSPTVLAVLLVDDNAEWSAQVVKRIEAMLPESNRVVRWEASLAAARKALETFHADATILDADLSDSPPDKTKLVLNEFPTPVYVVSNHFADDNPANDRMALEFMKYGAHGVYTKTPGHVDWLVREIVFMHLRRVFVSSH